MSKYGKPLLTLIFLLIVTSFATAQLRLDGYYRAESGITTTSPHDYLFLRNILQSELQKQSSDWRFKSTVQIRQSFPEDSEPRVEIRLREAFAEWYTDNFEITLGRQMIVWGRTDATQIMDIITPLDVSEFLTQDFNDLRQGINAVNASYFYGDNSFQFVVIPIFESPRLPDSNSRWAFFNESLDVTFQPDQIPQKTANNTQYAFKWSNRSSLKADVDFAFFYGFYPLPALEKRLEFSSFGVISGINASNRFRKSPSFILSGELRPVNSFSLQFESAFWLERELDILPPELTQSDNIPQHPPNLSDYDSRGFLSARSVLHSMIGFRMRIADWQTSFQFLADHIFLHDDEVLQEPWFLSASLQLNRSFLNENLRIYSLFRYNFEGDDYWLNTDLSYAIFDGLRLSSGAHLFGGSKPDDFYGHFSFYRYRNNSFIYLKLNAWF